jgi:aspartate ammonia-lyase
MKNQREISTKAFKESGIEQTPSNWHLWKRAFDCGATESIPEEIQKVVNTNFYEMIEDSKGDFTITESIMSPEDYVEMHQTGMNDCYCALVDYNEYESLFKAMDSYAKYYHATKTK